MYKMYLISAEGYINAETDFLKVRKTDKIWVSMKNVHDSLGAKKMKTKNETKKYKMAER